MITKLIMGKRPFDLGYIRRINEIISHTRVISSSRWLISSVSNRRVSSSQVYSKGIVCNIRIRPKRCLVILEFSEKLSGDIMLSTKKSA